MAKPKAPAAKAPAAKAPAAPSLAFSDPNFAGGLPGSLAPAGQFDPGGFMKGASPNTIRRYREAEVTHGRVAMLATLGILAGELVEGSSFLFDSQISGPAITHLAQVPSEFWALLVTGIGAAESTRLDSGWKDPEVFSKKGFTNQETLWQLRDEYYPGDIGFDPLSIKPKDDEKFEAMVTKELQNGRLAMIGIAGMVAQELVDGQGIFEHLRNHPMN